MLLEVSDLNIYFETRKGQIQAVKDLSFSIDEGETLGIVGESGCGKSITGLSLLDLMAPNARVEAKNITFNAQNLISMSDQEKRQVRGKDISMIFQDPMTSLNPSFTVGMQLTETIKAHEGQTSRFRHQRACELLDMVGISDPEVRMKNYPHELSGGMNQRVMIAQAIACKPKLLIADEPTTALDVTIQAQILSVLKDLQQKHKMAIMLISHDLGVVASMAKNTLVMYAGSVVEKGQTEDIIHSPSHPYTQGLLQSLPSYNQDIPHRSPLHCIKGQVVDLFQRPQGCQLHPRCPYVKDDCKESSPELTKVNSNQWSQCFYPLTKEESLCLPS